jgi:regulator of sirC expression with transglutaminase-like and TPR domain
LNRVIETRTGIPITMSLVFMELARRVGLSMHGVNLPSHFLLRPDSDELAVFVDAYDGTAPSLLYRRPIAPIYKRRLKF